MDICDQCFRDKASILIKSDTQKEYICKDCYNDRIAAELSVDLLKQPETIIVADSDGVNRHFNVQQETFANGIRLAAEENIMYGYMFEVHGDLNCDQEQLFVELRKKVTSGVSRQYIKQGKMSDGQVHQTMAGDKFVGRIEANEEGPDNPLIIIDGRPHTWEEVGKILMTNEGFQFQLKVYDMSYDVK